MSILPYPKYKDSGVEWLGQIPSGWSVAPLAVRYEILLGKMLDENRITGAHPMPYLRNQDVQWDAINTSDLPIMDIAPHEDDRYTVRPGDLLVCEGGEVGRAAIWSGQLVPCGFQKALHRLRPRHHGECVRYLFYCFRFAFDRGVFIAGANPNTISHLTGEMLRRYRFPAPPIEEQEAIATFLDDETAKLDLLVAEQRRLIELLKEKRQAVISHAVTKGLNPEVPMKASGVEWLGDVPIHWDIGSIKRFVTFLDGRRVPLSAEERSYRQGEVPYYGASGVIDFVDNWLFDENMVLVSEDGANLISRSSPIAFVATGKFWVNNHAHILKPIDDHLIFWAERIEAVDLMPFVTGSAQPKLTAEALGDITIAVPPSHAERAEIQAYILRASQEIDTLRTQGERAIALLLERRAALISAAVTGKIDVRHLADSNAA